MRELTFLETGYLCGGLLLCLALPLMMSFRGLQDSATRRSCTKIVWIGQTFLTTAGLTVLASAPVAPYAAAFGLVSSIACAFLLLRKFRAVRSA
jgi:hypothetical protein